MKALIGLVAVAGSTLAGCGGEDVSCGSENKARYKVTFNATWSQSTHPTGFPDNAHFSGLVGGTHTQDVKFWRVGENASKGIEEMAETGGKGDLEDEVDDAVTKGSACVVLSGDGVGDSPGSTSMEIPIDDAHPLITLTTMVAPSPDWFLGVDSLDLRAADGTWSAEKTVELDVYDAGTDSGTDFTSDDADTQPKEAIKKLTSVPFDKPFGTFAFEKI